jgi:predicted amidophosphoribosyltransferase
MSTKKVLTLGDLLDLKELPKCPYCGQTSDTTDPRVLCKECREDFGHTFYDEL